MLFKPESKDDALARKPGLLSRVLKRLVSTTITLVILGGLFYIGWLAFQPKQSAAIAGPARVPTSRSRCWPRHRACRMCPSISTASVRCVR